MDVKYITHSLHSYCGRVNVTGVEINAILSDRPIACTFERRQRSAVQARLFSLVSHFYQNRSEEQLLSNEIVAANDMLALIRTGCLARRRPHQPCVSKHPPSVTQHFLHLEKLPKG